MYSLGFDIGGTKCAVILGRGSLPQTDEGVSSFILERRAFETRQKERGPYEIIDELFATADEMLSGKNIEHGSLCGIGISCGGPLDSKRGVIMCPPNLPDWDNVPLVKMCEEHFGVKTNLQNDANACAVAEQRFGSGRGFENIVFLTFGTGMGAGLILNGRLYSGANDNAGEVGHIRLEKDGPTGYGKAGSFEGFCSGGGIARLGEIMLKKAVAEGRETCLTENTLSAKDIAAAAKRGDALAKEIYYTCAKKLGLGLSIIIDIINPDCIIIGSIYSRSKELFDSIINDVIASEALPFSAAACKILPSGLGDSIGDFAALGLAFE